MLGVEDGLAIGRTMRPVASRRWTCNWDSYETTNPVASQGSTCNWDQTNYNPSCESRLNLQLRWKTKHMLSCESRVGLPLWWNKLRDELLINGGPATGPKESTLSCETWWTYNWHKKVRLGCNLRMNLQIMQKKSRDLLWWQIKHQVKLGIEGRLAAKEKKELDLVTS